MTESDKQEYYLTESNELTEESSDLFEHFRFVVDKGQSLLRIDKFLTSKIESISRNRIQHAIQAGNILVNQQAVKPNYKVKPNDQIAVILSWPPREVVITPEHIPLSVVYEDNNLMVINKQPNLVVHPGHGNFNGTLLHGLAFYFVQQQNIPENGFGYLVHRIDKDTSGLLLVAKDELTQQKLASQFFHHTIERRYVALVWGDLKQESGTIEGHIGRSQKDRKLMAVYPEGETGKEAITHFRVLQRFGYVTLVECKLETGRTHQIRVHFKHIGHPLFNDEQYGGNIMIKGTAFTKYKQFIDNCFRILPRQALHAKTLGFTHPANGKAMLFDSDLPDDLHQLLEKWNNYTGSRTDEHMPDVY
jgi:23S rRNA pseudouridine1911/1915/1917 synthase